MNREKILGPLDSADDDDRSLRPKRMHAVSYTHLTLPTIYSV